MTTLDGRYHVVDRIAAGGMGEVFRARDAVLEREVAIKVLHRQLAGDAGFVDRFRREARAAASLSHPSIVGVYDWGAVDGIYYMVMEFVRGQSARDVLNAEGVLAPAQAADVLVQTLSALDHAHRQGIVHRDVKPENVMITREGTVKVADFGLARAYADAQITEAGTVTGTVQYLAPEQLQGEPADPRTDLYSVGVVAYELLTGRLPFTGETPMAIAYKHIHERMPAPSSRNPAVPQGIDGWVASMTEKSRELRPESAAEARRDLEGEARSLPRARALRDLVPDVTVLPIAVGPERADTVTIPRTRAAKHGRRRRGWWVVGLVLALVALGGAAWGAWTYLVPHEVRVPEVVGRPVEEARRLLGDADLIVRIGDPVYSLQVPQGRVLSVRPSEGTTLEEGDRVVLVPSRGPQPVRVPDLVGTTLEGAKGRLRAAHLRVGRVNEEYSDRLDAGLVIRQSVRADEMADERSEIDLVLSLGPTPVPVPKVVGLARDEAVARLDALGFLVDEQEDYSNDVPRGTVISQDPARRTELQPGNAVTIVVSLGPEEFELPSFIGMAPGAAESRLRELGLEPRILEIPGGTGLVVASQLPRAGTIVRPGDLITLYVT